MREVNRILCPTDFSAASLHAVEYARALARWYGARVVGLYVQQPVLVPAPVFEMAGYPSMPASGEMADVTALRNDVFGAMRGAAAADDVPVDAIVRTGGVAAEILECADVLPADLIVMGTHGAGGFEHLVLGSITEKVLRKARCPVLTVPPGSGAPGDMPFKRILCPVDFSDLSPAIVEFAGSLARDGAARVTLLHVLDWPADDEPMATRHFSVPEYRRAREEEATATMNALVSKTLHDGYRVETRFAHGKPYREILGVAAKENADLVVLGVQGRNALDLMLFGSTTNQVVRRAACPVLTLRQ